MERRRIGSLGVSIVGLGCNNFGGRLDEQSSSAVVRKALDEGVTLFDTADIYGGGASEEFLGRALGQQRDEVVIATKFGLGNPSGASAAAIIGAAELSLRRLGTDRIDVFQLHAPDLVVPIDETLGALDQLVRAGKVREIGCSNFDGRLLDQATRAAVSDGTARFVSVQNELSLLHRRGEADTFAACEQHDIAFLPYYPLASGLLTGKYRRGEPPPTGTRLAGWPRERRDQALADRRFDVVEELEAFACERGRSILQLAMSWLAGLPQLVSIIAGASTGAQVHANVTAVGWTLRSEERALIDRISPPTELEWGAVD